MMMAPSRPSTPSNMRMSSFRGHVIEFLSGKRSDPLRFLSKPPRPQRAATSPMVCRKPSRARRKKSGLPKPRNTSQTRRSVREDLNIELSHVLRVGDGIDADDLFMRDCEPQNDAQPSLQHNGQSNRPIHNSESRRLRAALEGLGHRRATQDFGRSTHLHSGLIRPEYNLGI